MQLLKRPKRRLVMLFNSGIFLYVFFPVVVVGFFAIGRRNTFAASVWLAAASLFFYGWWSVKAVPLLVGSVCCNFAISKYLVPGDGARDVVRYRWLIVAIAINLIVLAFFKYANFFVANLNSALSSTQFNLLPVLNVALPIGISFYTFTQIAFLCDCYQGKVRERRFVHYLLFVTYFPHLIAGPVLHHSQMMPQFARNDVYRPNVDKIAVGFAIFIVGLGKKLLLADPFGAFADPIFEAARHGTVPSLPGAWFAVLAYTLQIYFDFSGYSDMAIGLSLFFGVHLPINFNSPYQALSIIDFWRRWHISLSDFLRDYLYIPLGGNRLGFGRRYANVLITMVLGGLWHGANWTFIIWGAAHGALLTINHLWRALRPASHNPRQRSRVRHGLCWAATFVCVCLTWVLFKADSVATAIRIYQGLLGAQVSFEERHFYVVPALALGMIIVLAFPNTQTIFGYDPLGSQPIAGGREPLTMSLSRAAIVGLAALFFVSTLLIGQPSPFLYFQF